jgi:hypothetical protein
MLKKDYGSGPAYNGPMRSRRTNIHDLERHEPIPDLALCLL